MPLKPIFDKAPLTAVTCQPLRAGLVRADHAVLKQLYALAATDLHPAALEGTFRLACIVSNHPEEEPVTAVIRTALDNQQADGSFAVPHADSVAILRAAWALYEYEARKPVLEHIARWCGWAAQNWDALLADDAIWANPSDLMELLENLYRVTGKAALLTLCERLSSQSMVWSSVLNTISVQRPTNRSVSREEMLIGLERENGSREGFYTHYYRTNHPEQMADGARSAMAKGWYSGSATELNATRNAWERLVRHHGAICGGLTSDELLEGTSPSAAVSTAALGAWAEALCSAAMGDHAVWAWDAMERMVCNAMPACLQNGVLLSSQRVNSLTDIPSEQDCFHVNADHGMRALNRLTRGYAAVVSSAVTASPNGFGVNLYMPGKYAVPLGDALVLLTISNNEKGCVITVHCKQDVKAALRLRLPAWSRNTEVVINGMDSDAGKDCTAGYMTIERSWHDGDVISVNLEQTVRLLEGHHQGKYLLKGPVLMTLPVTDESEWAQVLLASAEEAGKITGLFDTAKEWKRKGDVPADIPVLPAASGREPANRELTPYAATPARIALFPGRKNA